MITKEITVKNKSGLHTRPAATLVKLAAKFKSEVNLERDGFSINAKSIIGVMTLAAEKGATLIIKTEGEDEETAMNDIVELFESGFGEKY